jgi:hypothetical protein
MDNLQNFATCNTDLALAYTSYLLDEIAWKTNEEKTCNVVKYVLVGLQEIMTKSEECVWVQLLRWCRRFRSDVHRRMSRNNKSNSLNVLLLREAILFLF